MVFTPRHTLFLPSRATFRQRIPAMLELRPRAPPALPCLPSPWSNCARLPACSEQSKVDPELTATLIQPVARVEIQAVTVRRAAVPASRSSRPSARAATTRCRVGAPRRARRRPVGAASGAGPRCADRLGDRRQAMPPRGGGSDLTDTEVSRAVAYLAANWSASFTEPPVEQITSDQPPPGGHQDRTGAVRAPDRPSPGLARIGPFESCRHCGGAGLSTAAHTRLRPPRLAA